MKVEKIKNICKSLGYNASFVVDFFQKKKDSNVPCVTNVSGLRKKHWEYFMKTHVTPVHGISLEN